MPFFISRDDITTLKTDAIVNAGNRELRMGGGVCGAIFKAAGAEEMERALQGLGPISIGDAVATPGFALPARYVIHTAGPIYHGRKEERDLLASCYRNSLLLPAFTAIPWRKRSRWHWMPSSAFWKPTT